MNQRKRSRRKFLRALVFAAFLCLSLCLSAAASPIEDAASAVSESVSDAGDALSEAVSDMLEGENGQVSDSDGIIGNESEEATDPTVTENESKGMMGWVAVLIAIAVVAVIVLAIVFLVPRRRVDD